MPITTDQIATLRNRFYRQMPNRAGWGSARHFRQEVSQAVFMSELDPNGHKILDPLYYENLFKEIPIKDKDGNDTGQKRVVEIAIERVSIPLQKVILEKHLTHLCGEKIKFILHHLDPTKQQANLFIEFKQGWEKHNMHTAIYEFCKSIKATGDGAFCAVMANNKFDYRVFSVLNNDTLHPIRDPHGDLRLFGRGFTAYDFERQEDVPYLEVWDDKNYTLFAYTTDATNDKKEFIEWDATTFKPIVSQTTDGWLVVKQAAHGFQQMPIVYLKDENGACWSSVQHLIDKLEMALSQLFENNKSYAFRIMVIKGEVHIEGDFRGQAKAVLVGSDGGAEFMDKADASSSFELQLKETLKYILLGSFTVLPPETISGDQSGIALKIRYSPAIEQGLNDKNFYNKAVDTIVELFKEGYGIELGKTSDYKMLDLRGEIQIYIHQNDSEVANNLVLGVQSGYISRQTASENSIYAAADEAHRLRKQKEQELVDERDELLSSESVKDTTSDTDQLNETNTIRKLTKSSV